MKAILQLGRAGDVINILPLVHKIWSETGEVMKFIVHEMYADILDGCSYLEPLMYDGDWTNVTGAKNTFNHYEILTSQIYGNGVTHEPQCSSFCEDSWLSAGYKYDPDAQLVFDRGDIRRENELIDRHIQKDGPVVLVNLSGNSSPFPAHQQIMELLYAGVGNIATIVDLSTIRAYRIYDLLGLYDIADLLITTDTATLHLAAASDIPNISFIVDTPSMWHGSVPKGNCILSMRYNTVIRHMVYIHKLIYDRIYNSTCNESVRFSRICPQE